jgi:glycosyltransferase involved in cell wall biosynthesis
VSAGLKVGVVADLIEEGWPSMDLVAEMLVEHLGPASEGRVDPVLVRPSMRRRFSRAGAVAGRGFTVDRLLNRFWDYPRRLRRLAPRYDVFHLVDHSYAQLVHELPAGRTVVTCHDLDTFRCLLEPGEEPRSAAFRAMVRRTLDGLRCAARIACPSAATRERLITAGLAAPDRVVVAPNGVHPLHRPDPDPEADAAVAELLSRDPAAAAPTVDLLHVGSTIERKRIDVLLGVLAALRGAATGPAALETPVRLIRVGAPLTAAQRELAGRLGVAGAVVEAGRVDRRRLAALYRRAALVLLPSEREGFGLPLVEAMACGTPVVASDLPVLREVGGEAAVYRPVGDVEGWAAAIAALVAERRERPREWAARRAAAIARAGRFGWREHARIMAGLYDQLLQDPTPPIRATR